MSLTLTFILEGEKSNFLLSSKRRYQTSVVMVAGEKVVDVTMNGTCRSQPNKCYKTRCLLENSTEIFRHPSLNFIV